MKRLSVLLLALALVSQVPGADPKGDPAATALLAEARAARANWVHFPGFNADIEINLNGKVYKTPLTVTPKGDIQLKVDDEQVAGWSKRILGSLVGHRMDDGTTLETPCAFADEDKDNPLGRAIKVLNDEYHSSYRIRDRQVIVVNRTMKDARFTITVLENRLTEEKQFLPTSYVVNYWDLKGEVLKRSEAHHTTWTRVDKFDLPASLLVLTATPAGQEARQIKFSNLRLGNP